MEKICIPNSEGGLFSHFGEAKEFLVVTINDDKTYTKEIVGTNGKSHHELIPLVADLGVTAMLVSGIGSHAVVNLAKVGVKVYPGVEGEVDDLVNDYINGVLKYDLSKVHKCSHGN